MAAVWSGRCPSCVSVQDKDKKQIRKNRPTGVPLRAKEVCPTQGFAVGAAWI